MDESHKPINKDAAVTSINQSGGIISNIVNINNAPSNFDSHESNDLKEDRRKILHRPCLVIHSKILQGLDVTLVKLRNEGFTAKNLSIAVILVDRMMANMIVDKKELEKFEVVCITLVGNLLQPTIANINISIGYEDIEGRRYQQHYTKMGFQETLTQPELMGKIKS